MNYKGTASRIGNKTEKISDEISGGDVGNEENNPTAAYAKGRVNSVKKKLYGINPCAIMRDDLASGVHKNRPDLLVSHRP